MASGPLLSEPARRVLDGASLDRLPPVLGRRVEQRILRYAVARAEGDAHALPREDRDLYLATLALNQARLVTTRQVLAAAERRALRLVPIKGIALVLDEARGYGDPGARPMIDVDLLSPAGDLPAAAELLRELGFAQVEPPRQAARRAAGAIHDTKWRRGPILLELHDRLWHELGVTADAAPLIGRAICRDLDGVGVFTLLPEDHLYLVLVHAALHGLVGNPLWRSDALLLLEETGPSGLAHAAALAARSHAAVALLGALDELARCFPTRIPRPAPHPGRLRRRVLGLIRPWLLRGEAELGPIGSRLARPLLLSDARAAASWARQKAAIAAADAAASIARRARS